MSNVTYVGRQMRSFNSSPQFDGYTKVIITASEDVEYSAGVDTGRTLTLNCPWGTQTMAENILRSISGYQYQPYTATDAIVDPAAELGDGITANNVYSGIYAMQMQFGGLCRSTVSAPADEELDHEYPYVPKKDRQVTRKLHSLSTELKVQAGLISAEVSERKSDVESLSGRLTVQANQISAEVSERKSETESLRSSLSLERDRITAEITTRSTETASLQSALSIQAGQIAAKVEKSGGDFSSFGWSLDDSSWTIKANSTDILKATKNGLEVFGKVTATSGKIGGFDILADSLSYNGQTWGGTNTLGGYFGVNGLQLGKNFKVDMAGNLEAASGTFSGAVFAGNIQYGDNYGTLHGSALSSHSITGSQIGYGAISTAYTSGGINTSLGYADFANGVFGGWNQASNMTCTNFNVTSQNFKFANKTCYLGSTAVATATGGTTTIRYIGWQ